MRCQLGLRSGKEPHSSAAGFNPCLQPQLVCWEESEGCAEVPNPLPQVEPAPFCRSPAILCQQVVPMPPLSKPFPWQLRGLARACTPHLGIFLCSPCLLNSLCSVAKVALAQKGGGGRKMEVETSTIPAPKSSGKGGLPGWHGKNVDYRAWG